MNNDNRRVFYVKMLLILFVYNNSNRKESDESSKRWLKVTFNKSDTLACYNHNIVYWTFLLSDFEKKIVVDNLQSSPFLLNV